MSQKTDLIIVGAGAAGLMAASAAAEYGLRVLVVERKNQPGRKLLMCGNNRCNLTSELAVEALLKSYGVDQAPFLEPAIQHFPPAALRRWFAQHRVPTTVKENSRVYPRTERANDVVNCFKDRLRDEAVPIVLNCPVSGIRRRDVGFDVASTNATFHAPFVLVATGGVSYPKTGSVGDGQKFARELGHKVTPYRPGLAAFELKPSWWLKARDLEIEDVVLSVFVRDRLVATTRGGIEIRSGVAHGPAMIDASNVVSRDNLRDYRFEVDLAAGARDLSPDAARGVLKKVLGSKAAKLMLTELPRGVELGLAIRRLALPVVGPRPLKEAMVTVGGVAIDEIDSATMQSRVNPGLYFAGEVMDVDGFCGGFNLQAAFATARLAVASVATKLGRELQQIERKPVRSGRKGQGGYKKKGYRGQSKRRRR